MSAGTRLKAPGAAALAVAALAALALTGASDAGAQDRCTVRGAKTVVASGASRVFSVAIKRGRKYYGCVRGGRPVFLARDYSAANSEEETSTNTMFRVSGSVVAWYQTFETESGTGDFVQAISVRTLPRGGRKLDVDVSGYQDLAALAVRADGAVAWILSTAGRYAEVDKIDSKRREPTPLSYARNIDSSSLRVDDDSVDWREAGASRSAPLR